MMMALRSMIMMILMVEVMEMKKVTQMKVKKVFIILTTAPTMIFSHLSKNSDTKVILHYTCKILECVGPLNPEVVQSTSASVLYPASSVLILAESDGVMSNGKANLWLAEVGKTTGQGFTIKLDACPRLIAGVQIKNQGKGSIRGRATKEFRVRGAINKNRSPADNIPWSVGVGDI